MPGRGANVLAAYAMISEQMIGWRFVGQDFVEARKERKKRWRRFGRITFIVLLIVVIGGAALLGTDGGNRLLDTLFGAGGLSVDGVPVPGAGEIDPQERGWDGEGVAAYVSATGYVLMGVKASRPSPSSGGRRAGVEAGVAAFGEAAAAAPEAAAIASKVGPMILSGVSAMQTGVVKILSLIAGYSVEDTDKIAEPISAGGGRVITWGIEKATGFPIDSAPQVRQGD